MKDEMKDEDLDEDMMELLPDPTDEFADAFIWTDNGVGLALPCEPPPQIAVVALQSNRLVFLTAFDDAKSGTYFFANQKILQSSSSYSQQLGEHLAVDPRSRAMAVAACEGRMCLYALKPMDVLRHEYSQKKAFMPIAAVSKCPENTML